MGFSLASLRRNATPQQGVIAIIYGPHGVGKTTFAAGAPAPVLMAIERGLGLIDIDHHKIDTFSDVMEMLGALYSEEHQFKTLIVDSLDWLEPLIWARACADNGWSSLEEPGYGKGYLAADAVWAEYLEGIRALRDHRGLNILQLAHEEIRTYQSPDTEPYDRHGIKLHKRANARVQEHADIIGFLSYRVSIKESKTGFGSKSVRAQGVGQRVLYLEERPNFAAKNRFDLPSYVDIPTVSRASQAPAQTWAPLGNLINQAA